MAHEVETMAYVGAVPWHGLGNQLSQSIIVDENGTPITREPTLEDWQQQAGLDWTVSKRPVYYVGATTVGNVYKDKFVLARDKDDKPYSVVSGRYKPVQPKQILEFFRDLVSRYGMTIETAGSLRDGQRVWAMAKTNEAHKVMGVDEIKGYLMLATSYDLTFSTMAYQTSIRVVCNNTLQASFGDMVNRITIPHFRDFNIEDVHEQMGMGRDQWAAFTQAMDTLAKLKIDTVKANEVMQKVFKYNPMIVDSENSLALKHATNVIDLFSGKAIGADVAGSTGWGLINATTEYLDQHKRARSASNRLDSSWFGEGFNTKQRTLDELLQLAA